MPGVPRSQQGARPEQRGGGFQSFKKVFVSFQGKGVAIGGN